MNDLELFNKTLSSRLKELEDILCSDCETGMSKSYIKKQFKFTKEQLGLK